MSYVVEFTQGAEDDLMRLYDFLLDRAETLEELDVADEAIEVIRQVALSHLSTTPYSYRKVGARSTLNAVSGARKSIVAACAASRAGTFSPRTQRIRMFASRMIGRAVITWRCG